MARPIHKVERWCRTCGASFLAWPYKVKDGGANYCSRKCFEIGHRKPRSKVMCQQCGTEFIPKSHSSRSIFCSRVCLGKSQSKGQKQGRRRSHDSRLARWARAVILRDRRCVRCGATGNLQAHHKQSYTRHPDVRFSLDNGEALCAPCHHSRHPYMELQSFLSRKGRNVEACVVCETFYVPWKPTQRTCSHRCGAILRNRKARAESKAN